jgi:hypothetical protein
VCACVSYFVIARVKPKRPERAIRTHKRCTGGVCMYLCVCVRVCFMGRYLFLFVYSLCLSLWVLEYTCFDSPSRPKAGNRPHTHTGAKRSLRGRARRVCARILPPASRLKAVQRGGQIYKPADFSAAILCLSAVDMATYFFFLASLRVFHLAAMSFMMSLA